MEELINKVYLDMGLPQNSDLSITLFKITFTFAICWLVFFFIDKIVLYVLKKLIHRTKTDWDDELFNSHFFHRIALIIPAILFKSLTKDIPWEYSYHLANVINIWILFAFVFAINAFLDAINRIYGRYQISKAKPIVVFIQVAKVVIYTIMVFAIVSIILGKPMDNLLYGLGAFAAVLMLIFKDSILGFVAGVQLMSNKMVAIGDWIEMPSANANGAVKEITLYTVKVQNWDMTISTVPTYKLVSESFTNWKGMEDSGGRRIKRYIYIDMLSVHFLSDEEMHRLRNSDFLTKYIDKMTSMLDGYTDKKDNKLDAQRLTNLGVFRIYLLSWMQSNKSLNQNMTMMVRQLQPTATGIPIEVYCFSAIQEWASYENVQSDLFDHILSVIQYFNLRIFQYPSNIFTAPSEGVN